MENRICRYVVELKELFNGFPFQEAVIAPPHKTTQDRGSPARKNRIIHICLGCRASDFFFARSAWRAKCHYPNEF